MNRVPPFVSLQGLLVGVVLGLGLLLPCAADAAVVDCSQGQTLASKVNGGGPSVHVTVRGTCTENVVITRDDVTIDTDGVHAATIEPADASQPTLTLDGAHRVVIDGVSPGGITVNGGIFGISASRGSTLDVRNCTVTGTSQNGVVSAYGSTVTVDGCTITGNAGTGGVAANSASLVVTNSAVTANAGTGLAATRSGYLRVGQDLRGTLLVKPVTISGNGANGISISESASGTVVGGTVETSGSTNVFIGRAASGQIGVGSNNLTGGVTIQNGARHGVSVEGGNATIAFSTISGNALTGIIVTNAGGARIGILNNNAGYGGNTISGNQGVGIDVAIGGAAFIGGNLIDGNGTAPNPFGRYGIGVFQASATLAGDNVISNNGESGIFVRAGQVLVGDGAFGLTTTNTISGNGTAGPNRGGVFAFDGGNILVNNATISDNVAAAVQVFQAGVIELRGATAVTVPAAGVTPGATVQNGSTLRLRDTASIVSATGDGIEASNVTSVNIRDGNLVTGAAGHFGILCFVQPPLLTASAATLTGNITNVTGGIAPTAGCNVFP